MCVLEALASGCPVIAPEIGWVPQFPHLSYKTGDIADLRRVLTECVEQKQALRRHVVPYSWDAWASKHHALFVRLLGFDPTATPATPSHSRDGKEDAGGQMEMSVALVAHGGEIESGIGGPSVRVPRTVEELRKLGVRAESMTAEQFRAGAQDIVHVYNVWPAPSCEQLLTRVERSDATLVFSPIFLDFSELTLFESLVPRVLAEFERPRSVIAALSALSMDGADPGRYPERGRIGRYHATVRRLASYADHLILLSEHERRMLSRIGVDHPSTSVVRNTTDVSAFLPPADPGLFAAETGVSDYVLCVGRIERRKNQAMLAFALRELDLPLVLVGRAPDPEYAELVRNIGGSSVVFAGHLPANSRMLASAYAGARVFCLPSWVEGASLAALEADASGCPLVLSNRASEREYFRENARYVDPLNPDSIREAVLAAFAEGREVRRAGQDARPLMEEGWPMHARETLAAYRSAMEVNRATSTGATSAPALSSLDLSNTADFSEDPAGSPPPLAHLQAELANRVADRVFLDNPESGQAGDDSTSPVAFPAGHGTPLVAAALAAYPRDQLIRLLHRTAFPMDGFASRPRPPLYPWLTGPPENALARYAFAADRLDKNSRVLDLSGGPGYGPYLLADTTGCHVDACDDSKDLVTYSRNNWRHKRVTYRDSLPNKHDRDGKADYDFAVAFFSPSLDNAPIPFLKEMLQRLKPGGALFFTLPFENLCLEPGELLNRCRALDAMVDRGGRLEVFVQRGTVIAPLAEEDGQCPPEAFLAVWRRDADEAMAYCPTRETFAFQPQHGEVKSVREALGALITFRWASLAVAGKAIIRRREWYRNRVAVLVSSFVRKISRVSA